MDTTKTAALTAGLQQRMRRAHEAEDGFTLIELLIVIVILGVLSAVVVFSVGGLTDRGERSACRATEKTLQVAVEATRANTGALPTTFGALVTARFLQADENFTTSTGASQAVTFGSATRTFALNTTTGEVTVTPAC